MIDQVKALWVNGGSDVRNALILHAVAAVLAVLGVLATSGLFLFVAFVVLVWGEFKLLKAFRVFGADKLN